METKEIIENNKLIALFMGYESNRYENLPNKVHITIFGEESGISLNQLKYHCSWDWLMPVVEKIESLGFWVEIRVTYIGIGKRMHEETIINRSFSSMRVTKIEALYKTVIEFIKWHNLNTKANGN